MRVYETLEAQPHAWIAHDLRHVSREQAVVLLRERAVDVQINRLRRKIERDPANPLFLQAVRGIGYRLVASP